MSTPEGGTTPRVELRDVGYRFEAGGRAVVDGVSLAVGPGQVVGIAGRNGSGKTTLVRLIAGLLRPRTGTVVVDGLDTARHDVQELAAHVGLVFQDPGHQLFASTVADELSFGPRNLGVGEAEVRARTATTAASLGLDGVLDAHPYRLGLARRRLVAIASVLTMRTPTLVLDEPTTGQDHRTVATLAGLVGTLRAAGTTVLVVAHDAAFLAEVADRLILLDAGRVIADGSPRALLADADLLEQAGIVAPPVTRLARRLPALAGATGMPALTVAELVDVVVAQAGRGHAP